MKTHSPAPLTLLLLAAAAACATSGAGGRAPESAAALALPEQDPASHGTARDRPLVTGIEQVTTAASLDETGRTMLVRVLAPELTPAGADDVRRAFEACPWAPPPEGTGLAARIATVRVRPAALEPAR